MTENNKATVTTIPITTFPDLRPLRVVFYAVNGLGLGHLTRLLAICLAMRQSCAGRFDFQPFFLTTSNAAHLLSRYGIPYIQLPSKTTARQTGWLGVRRLARMSQSIVNSALETLQPHILVVDSFPLGALRDLEHYLRYGSTFNVFIHRAGKPDAYEPANIFAQKYYDLVVAPHYQDRDEILLPPDFEAPVYWSGPVFHIETQSQLSRADLRRQLGLNPFQRLGYLSLGGGGDESDPELLQQVWPFLQKTPRTRWVLGAGFLSGNNVAALENVTVWRDYPAHRLFPALDFAVSAAGYNTFHELLHFGVPTLFLPRERGFDDQTKRAEHAAKARSALVCATNTENWLTNFQNQFRQLLQPAVRRSLTARARSYVPANHAAQLAEELLTAYQKFLD